MEHVAEIKDCRLGKFYCVIRALYEFCVECFYELACSYITWVMLPRIFYFSFALLFCFAYQQPSSSKTTTEGENQSQISSSNNTVTHNADSNIEDFGIFLHVKPNHFKANDDSIKLVYVVTNNLDSIVQFGSCFIIEKWEGNEWISLKISCHKKAPTLKSGLQCIVI